MVNSLTLSESLSKTINSKGRPTIWLLSAMVFTFIAWANFADLKEIVRGVGRVVPAMQSQAVQNLEGGIVREIFVAEGDTVEDGQLVVRMDRTKSESSYRELSDQRLALLLKLQRLEAEKAGLAFAFSPTLELQNLSPEYAASERALYEARKAEFSLTIENLQKALELKSREVDMLVPMVAKGAVPELEVVRARQALVDVKSRLDGLSTEFKTEVAREFAQTLGELGKIEAQLNSRKDQLIRTDVRSPVRGIVNKVAATTIGGVVAPGETLLEILPLEEPLRVEGQIDPRDIGFVHSGMEATVKLTAFDYSIFGTLTGTVSHVGADTIVDEADPEAVPFYQLIIELDKTTLSGPSGSVAIKPGMQAEIELGAGEKTVLQYLLKPLFKTTEALTER